MTGVFVYLTVCSIRNGIRVRFRQLRQPRYIIIAVAFLLYAGSMVMGRSRAPIGSLVALDDLRGRAIVAAAITALLAASWIMPAGGALRFSSAEVQFLFPAPISRRRLLAYKVGRLLLGSAASGAFLTIFVGPARLGPGLVFAARAALVMAVFTLYGAGVTMYRTRAKEEGTPGMPRWRTVAGACALTPMIGVALTVIAFSNFVIALPVSVVLLAANALWIIQSDSAFEEAATDAAEKASRATAAGHFVPRIGRKRTTPFRLAARGPVETAILWKNWLLIGRTSRRALVFVSVLLLGTVMFGIITASGADRIFGAETIGEISMAVVALATLMGPAMLRIDLRHDLGHLALIKTWPVRGPAVIRGELLAPAIALSLVAGAAIAIGAAFAPDLLLVEHPHSRARIGFALSAVLAAGAVIVAQLVIHNGIAVSFPAWAELKVASGAATMEMNVRMMIVMYGALLGLAVLLIVPAAVATTAYWMTDGLLIAATIFAVLLLGESLVATEAIGRILDRTDLQAVVLTE